MIDVIDEKGADGFAIRPFFHRSLDFSGGCEFRYRKALVDLVAYAHDDLSIIELADKNSLH